MTDRYGELTHADLLLITSRQDHVVEPRRASTSRSTTAADVEHVWLERSYHVATQDYDARPRSAPVPPQFVARVTGELSP